MKRRVNIFLLIMMSGLCSHLLAAETDDISLDFLAFLGSFETKDGQWLDPVEIEKMLQIKDQKDKDKEPDNE